MKNVFPRSLAAVAASFLLFVSVYAQPATSQDAELRARRSAIEAELQSVATVYRKVMVPMRDGTRMQAEIYRPKDKNTQ